MKKVLSLVLAAVVSVSSALAQTAQFPTALATDQSLSRAVNNISTTLAAAMGSGDTIITVSSATGVALNMLLNIDSEIVQVTAINGNNLTVTRAFDSTTAASHLARAAVKGNYNAWPINSLSAEVKAIESTLGTNLGNLPQNSLPTSAFNFTAQTPGGSLINGNNPITMTPVPRGVNGTDSSHYLYVSGGTGSAEACLITGGTGTSGQTSGTIIVNCSNAHSGAWTIRSASSGIEEAIVADGTSGYAVQIAPGQNSVYKAIAVTQPIEIYGSGMGAQNGGGDVTSVTMVLPQYGSGDVITATGLYGFYFHDFQVNSNVGRRSSGSGISISSGVTNNTNNGSVITRVMFNNQYQDINLHLTSTATIEQTYHQQFSSAGIYCDGNASTESSCGNIDHNYFILASGDSATPALIDLHAGYVNLHHNLMIGGTNAVRVTADGFPAGGIRIESNFIENQYGNAVLIQNGSGVIASNVQVKGNEFMATSADSGASIAGFIKVAANAGGSGSWISNVDISGNALRGQLTNVTTPYYISVLSGTGVALQNNIVNHITSDTGNTYVFGSEVVAGAILTAGPETGTSTGAKYSGLTANVQVFDQQGLTFANLPATIGKGSIIYVSDATIANPCAGSSSGAIAKRLNAAWVCN